MVGRKFLIEAKRDFLSSAKIILGRDWNRLVDPPIKLSHEIIQDFYGNTLPIEYQQYSFTTMFRVNFISFNQDAINDYLGKPLTLEEGEVNAYSRCAVRGN